MRPPDPLRTFRRLGTAAVSVVALAMAGACVVPPPPPPPPASYPGLAAGGRYLTFPFGGNSRSYYLYVPAVVAANPNTPVPLVIGLHGGGGYAGQMASNSGLVTAADRDGFLLVFPEGVLLPRVPGGVSIRTWDAGFCCPPAMGTGVDDVGYVAALVADLEATTAIDRANVVAAGHSNGAMLTWRIACERADVITGAVVVEGSLERPSCTPSRGVDLVQIHGDNDTFVPLEGGNGPDALTDTEFQSVAASQSMWTAAVGCTGSTPSTGDHLTITLRTGCADATTTKLVVIAGGTHAWPGSDPAQSADFLGEPSPYFSASTAITDLVASH